MRVLIPIHSGHGHVQQMIPLAQAFVGVGHEVLIVCEQRMGDFVAAAGLPVEPVYENSRHPMTTEELARISKVNLERLMVLAPRWKPDVVIREWAEMAGLVVAVELGIPCVVCGRKFRPAAGQAGSHPCLGMMEKGIEYLLSGKAGPDGFTLDMSRVAARHARLARRADGTTTATMDLTSLFGDLFVSFYPPGMAFPGANPLPGEQFVRPPIHDDMPGLDTPAWLAELTDRPIVFTTLGTTINHVGGVFERIIEAAEPLDVHLVATVGPDRDPEGLGPLPANVHVARYIPSSQIMPRAAAAIVHGGFSTTMTALTYGVPLLCLPVYGDQPVNAQRYLELGVALSYTDGAAEGVGVTAPEVDAARLGGLLERLLGDQSFRTAARNIARDIAALPPIDVIVPLVEDLVAAGDEGLTVSTHHHEEGKTA